MILVLEWKDGELKRNYQILLEKCLEYILIRRMKTMKILNKKEMIELINGIITFWEQDTCMLSYHDRHHPAFSLVKKIAARTEDKDLVITTILKNMEKEITWFYIIFYDIILPEDQPKITEDMMGKIKDQTEVWIKWGYDKGYLNE